LYSAAKASQVPNPVIPITAAVFAVGRGNDDSGIGSGIYHFGPGGHGFFGHEERTKMIFFSSVS